MWAHQALISAEKSVRNYARRHKRSAAAWSSRAQTYLPLLLLPGGVQQQVPVPVLLLGHIRVFMVDRIGVAVCDLGFDSRHRSASVRTSQVPLSL